MQELRCLQEHYKELHDPCRVAVREFTQEELDAVKRKLKNLGYL